ncbi:MAG: NAD-dependent epimerase/dehydratase family protein [Gemmatimonadaceae bacterium]
MNEAAPRDQIELEERLSRPDDATRSALAAIDGDVLILGAGGKMGPTLARMARRALDDIAPPRAGASVRRVIAVSRFSNEKQAIQLADSGVEIVRADLADPTCYQSLPKAPNVIWMVGQKFGSSGDPVGTWAHNVSAAVYGADHCAHSRVVCFSSGNVYGRTALESGGSLENDELSGAGEYASSCIGRERMFEAAARRLKFPLLLYRLFYACDLRYGVVTDIALRIFRGEPVSLLTRAVNVIWQGDANNLALRSLNSATIPGVAVNVTGKIVLVKTIAERIAQRLEREPTYVEDTRGDLLLANTDRVQNIMPYNGLALETLCDWAADWVHSGSELLNKPTKYDVRDGKF